MHPLTADVLSFWGKARPDAEGGPACHPLAYHLLDVAATADAILGARPLALARIGRLLAVDPERARILLVTLTALHDIGKFAPAFQAKAPEHWPDALGRYTANALRGTRHTDDGYVLWRHLSSRVLKNRIWRGGGAVLEALAPGIFGHHGRPIATGVLRERLAESVVGETGLRIAIACAEEIVDLLHPITIDAPPPPMSHVRVASWLVAGLVNVADWVGSRQLWFPYVEASCNLKDYWERARRRAASAIQAAGLRPSRAAELRTLAQLTGSNFAPTPAQEWASEVELPIGPTLVILEDVTGSGKTEAAQILVHRFMAAGHATGAYWAMPTQATANAMYLRQASALRALFADDSEDHPSLVLAHGQARLHEKFRATVIDSTSDALVSQAYERSDTELSSTAACAAFLADDRRAAILADIGAGTVDQALLGVLPTRFNALRLFGLADKVLVVDEAHAYDAYITVEVRELLRFQAAFGGCAVVLSATLAKRQREELATAWLEGIDAGSRRAAVPTSSMAYPLATVVAPGENVMRETSIQPAWWSVREVHVRYVHEVEPALDYVFQAAERGAAVAWVRNTVDDCLTAAAALRERGLTPPPLVFHARFAQCDRQARELEVVEMFKGTTSNASGRGRVVVATQVIEQSLDLDFDAMVTDLAPVDLLIQRAGRLWRHSDRDALRPSGLRREIVVLAPRFEREPDKNWLKVLLPGTAAVYKDVGVMWRTVRALLDAGMVIRTPAGVRPLVEAVYASDNVPAALEAATAAAEGRQHADAAAANFATLDVRSGYDGNARGWIDDLRARTRLDDDRLIIRLARVTSAGALAPWALDAGPPWKRWALSEIQLSSRRVPRAAMSNPRWGAAVDAERAEWGHFEREIPLLPLEEVQPGQWEGDLVEPTRGRVISVGYTASDGLAFLNRSME